MDDGDREETRAGHGGGDERKERGEPGGKGNGQGSRNEVTEFADSCSTLSVL